MNQENIEKCKYNLVYITDHKYVLPTKVSIRSAIANAHENNLTIWVMGVELDQSEIQEFHNLSCENANINVIVCDLEYKEIGKDHSYVSKAALMKFKICQILKELDTVLYVDCDTLLYDGYLSIFDYDISEHYFAAVRDVNVELNFERKELIKNEYYYNTGIMYFNIKKMLEEDLEERLVEAYLMNDDMKFFQDQDALNYVLGNGVLSLPLTYNMLEFYRHAFSIEQLKDFWPEYSDDEIKNVLEHPYIIHFAGTPKPWDDVLHGEHDIWVSYLTEREYMNYSRKAFKNCVEHEKILLDKVNGLQWIIARQQNEIKGLQQKISEIARQSYHYPLGKEIAFRDVATIENDLLEGVNEIEDWGRWSQGNECVLHLKIDNTDRDLMLEMDYVIFNEKQRIQLFVNDTILTEYEENGDRVVRKIVIPNTYIDNGNLEIKFELPDACSPLSIGKGGDSRILALGFVSLKISAEDRETLA